MTPQVPLASALQTLAGFLVLLGWLVTVRGLYFLSPSPRPELDLEAGPAFAMNVMVYLPSLAITVLLLVVLAVTVATRRLGPVTVVATAGVVFAFCLWVLTQDALLGFLPGLGGHLWSGVALSGTALVVACAALVVTPGGPTSTPTPARETG